jgi:hypothetical protein
MKNREKPPAGLDNIYKKQPACHILSHMNQWDLPAVSETAKCRPPYIYGTMKIHFVCYKLFL